MRGDKNQLQATHKERNGQYSIAFVAKRFNNGFFGRLRFAHHGFGFYLVCSAANECSWQHDTGQANKSDHGHLPVDVGNERLRHG